MKINLESELRDPSGGPDVSLSSALMHLLYNSAPGETGIAMQCGRLGDRIGEAKGSVELSDADKALVRTALKADKGMKAWALEGLEYYLWPDELAKSDRERLSKRFNGKAG